MNGTTAPWADADVDTLKRLWRDGCSASIIAEKLHVSSGVIFSRSAVLGKAHRLNLPKRDTVESQRTLPRDKRIGSRHRDREKQREYNRAYHERQKANRPARVASVRPMPPEPTPLLLTVLTLTYSVCHWPIGDPKHSGFGFCGHMQDGGQGPYCTYHNRLSFRPGTAWNDRRMRTPDSAGNRIWGEG